jgi:hypothetical protein
MSATHAQAGATKTYANASAELPDLVDEVALRRHHLRPRTPVKGKDSKVKQIGIAAELSIANNDHAPFVPDHAGTAIPVRACQKATA